MLKLIQGSWIPVKEGGIYYFTTKPLGNNYPGMYGIYIIDKIDKINNVNNGYYCSVKYFLVRLNPNLYLDGQINTTGLVKWAHINSDETVYIAEPEDLALFLLTKAPLHEISDNRYGE